MRFAYCRRAQEWWVELYSAEWYRAVFDAIPDQVLVKAEGSRILLANRAFLDNYGMSLDDLVQTFDSDSSDPDDTLQYVRDDYQVFRSGEPLQVVEPVTGHDGEVRYFDTVKGAIRHDGETIGTVGVSRPADAVAASGADSMRAVRKQTADMLRQLIASSPTGMMVLDAQLRCICVSPLLEQLVGVAISEGAVYSEVAGRHLPLANPASAVLSGGDETSFEATVVGTGNTLKVFLRPWPLPGYEVGGVLVQVLDLTEVHAATERVKASEARLATKNRQLNSILESLPVGVVVADADDRVMLHNSEADRLLGHEVGRTASTWSGQKRVLDAQAQPLSPADFPLALAIAGQARRDRILAVEGVDGQVDRWISVSASPLRDSGEAVAMATYSDISGLIRVQRSLEEFAYVASHDLREPLRMVSGFVSLLDDEYGDQLPEEAREYMRFAVDGAERMKVLVQDILSLSKATNRPLELVTTELDGIFATVLADLDGATRDAVVQCSPLPVVEGDPALLRALAQNLLTNAVKFRHPDRAPVVRVELADLGPTWRVSVVDNGIGIAPEHQAKVFQMFQRLHGKGAHPGTGIGLAHAKRIVERHGGMLGVTSVPGEGSTFWFTLPKAPIA